MFKVESVGSLLIYFKIVPNILHENIYIANVASQIEVFWKEYPDPCAIPNKSTEEIEQLSL